jgi:hypothetical protein
VLDALVAQAVDLRAGRFRLQNCVVDALGKIGSRLR